MATRIVHQLGFRIIVLVLVFLCLVAGLQLYHGHHLVCDKLQLQAKRQGYSLVVTAAAMSVEAILVRDYPVLETFAQSLVHEESGVRFASFISLEGHTMATWPPTGKGSELTYLNLTIFRQPIVIFADDETTIGYVELGMDMQQIADAIKAEMNPMTVNIICACLLMSLIITWFLQRELRHPLEKLTSYAHALGQGKLDDPIPFFGKGELGSLALVLEDSRQRLSASRHEVAAKNASLRETLSELDRSLQKAERLAKAKDEFLATMSHEIRTPMNGVQGMLTRLLNGGVEGENKERARVALQSAQALNSLLNDILDVSKLESGLFQLDHQSFDMFSLIHKMGPFISGGIQGKEIVFETNYPSDLPKLLVGDSSRIRQVLLNLLGNAMKFTEKGTISLDVQCTGRENGKAGLLISVTDTGIGISPENQEVIFDRFTQSDSSTTRQHGGTGLGLAISTQLVSLMGGTLKISSIEGVGSRFYFDLELPISHTTLPVIPLEFGSRDFQGCRILIVDDVEVNLLVAESLLEGWGCHITTAENGIQAVDLVRTQTFDLVLMDIMMPEMDGVEATGHIRNLGGPAADLAVVAVTANAMLGDREKYLAAGLDDYISKPLLEKDLERVVDRWFVGGKC